MSQNPAPPEPGRILVVEDDRMVRRALVEWLGIAGHHVIEAEDGATALAQLPQASPELVLSDIRMPGLSGLDLLARIRAVDPDLPVVLVTGHGDVPMAVAAMQGGAHDFVTKPYDPDHLAAIIARGLAFRRLRAELAALRSDAAGASPIEARLLGPSRAMEQVRRQALKLAGLPVDVLVAGETGTGKDVLAEALHAASPRASRPFVALNCAAIPADLAESELFGHEDGAFTGARAARAGKFEAAQGGTIFLDEIESMPLALQVKVLRVLQERQVERLGSNKPRPLDLRVIAATKADLRKASEDGRFRADLFYRLNGAELHLPPLRLRDQDALLLFELFSSRAARSQNLPVPQLALVDREAILSHAWPGNVRELKAVAERFAYGLVEPQGGLARLLLGADAPAGSEAGLIPRLEDYERMLIRAALAETGGTVSAAAERLGLPRRTLSDRMARLGMAPREAGG
ncbi:MAG: sigma-54 dependent transcriptional regulator [Beijerinckiaceae bacterium]|nr:sigma-54 dependent transcriptional regulator [Beijerinckiaceae bacterium]MCZ8301769.1 sigma-54 dependent transcriptional regulator [Beijerinckiaceae bacterium]